MTSDQENSIFWVFLNFLSSSFPILTLCVYKVTSYFIVLIRFAADMVRELQKDEALWVFRKVQWLLSLSWYGIQ